MSFNLSPSVNILEKDFSTFVSGVSTSTGALVGEFAWGPANTVSAVVNEESLVNTFGKPNDSNYNSWFTAYNFLNYGRDLRIARVLDSATALNASDGTAILIDNAENIDYTSWTDQIFVAKYAGALGNDVGVSVCQYADFNSWSYKEYFDQYPRGNDVYVVITLTENGQTEVKEAWALNLDSDSVDGFNINNYIQTGLERSSEYLYASASALIANGRKATTGVDQTDFVTTAGSNVITSATALGGGAAVAFDGSNPVVVGDQIVLTGQNAGTYDVVAITDAGTLVLSQTLEFSETAVSGTFQGVLSLSGLDSAGDLTGGADGTGASNADFQSGWDLFANAEEFDISLCMAGASDATMTIPKYIIENICEVRKDCVAFVSPQLASAVTSTTKVTDMIADRQLLTSSSYGFMDANYKYQYDKYNDVYRWVPMNGDIAGLAALTDSTNDAWWSFAGYNRGQVKNVTKIAFKSTKADRDRLYLENLNPVIIEPGEGTILLGDKTLQTKASAFDRINVRRLFIVLEKSIANAAKYNLFEFNDEFTRNRFVQTVTPFLRDVQARRGVTDFEIIADESVNTPAVIDANEFRASILVKPNKSINYINLTFTAVSSSVAFDEIIV